MTELLKIIKETPTCIEAKCDYPDLPSVVRNIKANGWAVSRLKRGDGEYLLTCHRKKQNQGDEIETPQDFREKL